MKYLLCLMLLFSFSACAELIVPGDNLVVEGIPPLSSEIKESTKNYTDFRSSLFGAWHPKRHEMLVINRAADQETPQAQYLNEALGERKILTNYKDKIASVSFEPLHGDYFIFHKDVGGGEWYQNFLYDMKTAEVTMLTDGKSRNSEVLWSNKGDKVIYSSTKRNGKDADFYIMDPLHPSEEKMLAQLDNGDAWSLSDWSPDDKMIVAIKQISITNLEIWVFDVATGKKWQIKKQTRDPAIEVAFQDAKFSSDGKSLYVITDEKSEFLRLVKIDLSTEKRTVLSGKAKWDIEEMALSPDGKKIAYTTNEDGSSVLHLRGEGKEKTIKGLPLGVISSLNWHPEGKFLAFNLNSARFPSDVMVLNSETSEIKVWTKTKSPSPDLDINTFVEPTIIHWPSFDNLSISALYYKPDPKKFPGKRPVIVNIHGGPESQSTSIFQGTRNYYLNEMGIAIIFPNIRGSKGYGKTFLSLDNGHKREGSYKDLESLLDWIKKQEDLDGNKILVTGGSYGGHATLAVATRYNNKIAAAIDVVGMSNLVTFLEKTEPYRRDLRRVEYGDERDPAMRAFLEEIAPLKHASNITKPLFIVQGANDPRVPYQEAEQMVEAVKKNNTPVWYLKAMDEGHGFAKKKNSDFQFYATVEFLRKFLLQ